MEHEEPTVEPVHVGSLELALLYDQASCRPILQVTKTYRGRNRDLVRIAVSPNHALPDRLIQDFMTTFMLTFLSMARFTFGIQEELEMGPYTGYEHVSAEKTTGG